MRFFELNCFRIDLSDCLSVRRIDVASVQVEVALSFANSHFD